MSTSTVNAGNTVATESCYWRMSHNWEYDDAEAYFIASAMARLLAVISAEVAMTGDVYIVETSTNYHVFALLSFEQAVLASAI